MSLPYRQQRTLRSIDRTLSRSDPRLARMLSIFAQVSAGEEFPRWEQLRTPLSRIWYLLAWLAGVTARRGVLAAGAAYQVLRRAATACVAVTRVLAARLRRPGAAGTADAGPGRAGGRPRG